MESMDEMRERNKSSPKILKKQAESQNSDFISVARQRQEFLFDMLLKIAAYQNEKLDTFPGMTFEDVKKELVDIDHAIKFINHPPPQNEVTQDMIESARTTSVTSLIEFVRGKTKCINPLHDDANPSAYYATRTNRLICPVCSMTWDAISIKMILDGINFHSAVRGLNNGSHNTA